MSSDIVFGFTDILRRQALPKVGDWESEVTYSFGRQIFVMENIGEGESSSTLWRQNLPSPESRGENSAEPVSALYKSTEHLQWGRLKPAVS